MLVSLVENSPSNLGQGVAIKLETQKCGVKLQGKFRLGFARGFGQGIADAPGATLSPQKKKQKLLV